MVPDKVRDQIIPIICIIIPIICIIIPIICIIIPIICIIIPIICIIIPIICINYLLVSTGRRITRTRSLTIYVLNSIFIDFCPKIGKKVQKWHFSTKNLLYLKNIQSQWHKSDYNRFFSKKWVYMPIFIDLVKKNFFSKKSKKIFFLKFFKNLKIKILNW